MELVRFWGRFCLLASLFFSLGACAHLEKAGLDGNWSLTTQDHQQTSVRITSLGNSLYYLYHPNLPLSGTYSLSNETLTMLKANNPRASGFRLRKVSTGHFRVVAAPPVRLTGDRYLGADLLRSNNR